jgi:hypothetical protein
MALDDLMECMAKGVTRTFFALMLGVLAVALARGPVFASQHRDTDVVDPHETTASDQEWTDWSNDLWCQLLHHDSPLVRLRVHNSLLLQQAHQAKTGLEHVKRCDQPLPEPSGFRREALAADPENPAVIAMVYRLECADAQPADWCIAADLRQRLLDIDPDNAYPHLLFLERLDRRAQAESYWTDALNSALLLSSDQPQALTPFSAEAKKHLLAAAEAETLDIYWGHGMPEALAAIESALDAYPPFEPSPAAREEMAELAIDFSLQPIEDVLSMGLLTPDFLRSYYNTTDILSGCMAAEEAGDREVVDGCQRLGRLAESQGHTTLSRQLGALLGSLADGGIEESAELERDIRFLVDLCNNPKGGGVYELPGPMPAGETLRYYQDVVDHGEVQASERKAAREFAVYPEAFVIDPSRCNEIDRLEPAQKSSLVALWRERSGVGGAQQALNLAAEWLSKSEPKVP